MSEARAKIGVAAVCKGMVYDESKSYEMCLTRWLRISEALANLG
jgi:hypothetical protein